MGEGLENFVNVVFTVGALTVAAIPVCRLGPLDIARTTYNFTIGDAPVLKQELVEYCREGIKKANPSYTEEQVEGLLKVHLKSESGEKIDPTKVSIEDLWDTSETYAHDGRGRWFWADF